MINKIKIIFLLFAIFFSLPQTVTAQGFSLTLTPPLLRVHIKPGKTITQVFQIQNKSQSDQTLVARLVPFNQSDSLGNPIINPKNTSPYLEYFSLANANISLNQPFTIPQGKSEQLILTLKVPSNAPTIDLYFTLLLSTYQSDLISPDFQGSSVNATLGSNLLITISQDASPDTAVTIDNLIPKGSFLFRLGNLYFADNLSPLTFEASATNKGRFTTETKGVFRLTQNQKPKYLQGILPQYLIANSARNLQNTQGESFFYSPQISDIGLFKAEIEIKTDNTNSQTSIDIVFLPLKIIIGAFVISLILLSLPKPSTKG